MDASQVPESRLRLPQDKPHPTAPMFHVGASAEHPQDSLDEFYTRLAAAELAFVGSGTPQEADIALDYLRHLTLDLRRLQAAVQLWFQQNCPRLGLDMNPTGPTHVSGPFNQVLNDLDSKAHVLAIRELAARTFNVRLDLEEATAYDFDIEGEDGPGAANLKHLEAAVDRARAALTVIARDLLLSVGITPENGGGHV